MATAKELYPNNNYFSDYDLMLREFGTILIQVDEDGYSGDSWVLYKDKNSSRLGYLNFGWGSCSGCDALQACSSYEEVQELMDQLFNSIQWWDNPTDALEWFKTHDWEGDYYCASNDRSNFVSQVIEYLESLL